jgi:hypothetical protein
MLPFVQQGITVGAEPSPRAAAAGRRWLFATYLAVATVDAWVVSVLTDAQRGRDNFQNLVSGTVEFVTGGIALTAWIAVAMIPAVALSVVVAARSRQSLPGRMFAGTISWGAWSAVLFLGIALMFRQSVFETWASIGLALLAVSGAAFAAIGLRSETPPPGRGLTSVALLIAGFVVLASVFLAGRFPGPS